MDVVFRNFYKNFYLRTGGFISSSPINQPVFPGDFFQIINGEIVVLGNIFRNTIVDSKDCKFDTGIKLNPAQWMLKDGISKPYSGHGTGTDGLEFSKEIVAFKESGSFFFKGNDPESIRIANWDEICRELIIKMTVTYYSFRELYIVTESVSLSDWTLAISASGTAEIELASDEETLGLFDIFGHHTTKVIQSKGISFYHQELNRKPAFFKAKKLVVQKEKLNEIIIELRTQRETENNEAHALFGTFTSSVVPNTAILPALDMLPLNTLNANTAFNYFDWESMNLDDVEKYFTDGAR